MSASPHSRDPIAIDALASKDTRGERAGLRSEPKGSTNPFLARKHKPIVVGHRGVPTLHQENTLAGFRRAVSLGVPAVELDARLTRDGKVVVFHDADLARMTGFHQHVADLTWDQVSRLRVRRDIEMGRNAQGEHVIVHYEREEPIPLLAEVLAELGSKVVTNIELKLDYAHWWRAEVGGAVAHVVAEAHAVHRVILTSFDPRKLRAATSVRPDLAVGFCWDETMLNFAGHLLELLPPIADHGPVDRRSHANCRRVLNRIVDANVLGRLLDYDLVGAEHTLVGRDTVQRLHGQHKAIGTHVLFPVGSTTGKPIAPTAMLREEAERLVALGVDWIETDDPERLLEIVG